jgi:hypothetical protein
MVGLGVVAVGDSTCFTAIDFTIIHRTIVTALSQIFIAVNIFVATREAPVVVVSFILIILGSHSA